MEFLNVISQVLARLPLWGVFSIPLFLVMWGAYVFVGKCEINRAVKVLVLSLSSTFLITPMPMGMFLAFVPNGYLLFSGADYYHKIWVWGVISGAVTFIISLVCFHWLISHNKLSPQDAEQRLCLRR